jgi:hypothetical protein
VFFVDCYDLQAKQKVNLSNLFLEKFSELQKVDGKPSFNPRDTTFFYVNRILTIPVESSRFEGVCKDYRGDNKKLADYIKSQNCHSDRFRILMNNGDYNVVMSTVFHVLKEKDGKNFLAKGFPKEYYVEKAQEQYSSAAEYECSIKRDGRAGRTLDAISVCLPLLLRLLTR